MTDNGDGYRPLDTDEVEIRLLRLQPAGEDDTIHASFVYIDIFNSQQSYEALSYTWGPDTEEESIQLCGAPFTIRRNLHNLLRRLQADDVAESRLFWVDAICINQSDIAEKQSQVQIIGPIFQHAESVRVWVGEHADHSEELFKPWPFDSSAWTGWSPALSLQERLSIARGHQTREEWQNRWRIFTTFLERPYWNRTWIVQEIALALDIKIQCGPDVMGWDELIWSRVKWSIPWKKWISFLLGIQRPGYLLSMQWSSTTVGSLVETRYRALLMVFLGLFYQTSARITGWGARSTIFATSAALKDTECLDRRDRVYSLLWLEWTGASEYPRLVKWRLLQPLSYIMVDYSLSVPELFLRVCWSRLLWPPRLEDAFCAASLLTGLRVTIQDIHAIIDLLLDDLDIGAGKQERYLLWVVVAGLRRYEKTSTLGFNCRFRYKDSISPRLASHKRMKNTLAEWREAQKATNGWLTDQTVESSEHIHTSHPPSST